MEGFRGGRGRRGGNEVTVGGGSDVPYRSKRPSVEDLEGMLPDLEKLTGAAKGRGKQLSPEVAEVIASFRKTLDGLRQQAGVESNDFRSDLATKAMLRAVLEQVYSMIPVAAEKYHTEKNESAAYAFNALVNQAKDINAQMRALDTLEEQADHIVTKIMMPAFILATQNLVNGWMAVKPTIDNFQLTAKQTIRLKETIDNVVREHGKYLEELMKDVNVKTKSFLLGDDNPKPKKIKKK